MPNKEQTEHKNHFLSCPLLTKQSHNTDVAWGASVNKSAFGTCSEHVWCVPEEAQPEEKSVIAFIDKLTRFFYSMCPIWHTMHLRVKLFDAQAPSVSIEEIVLPRHARVLFHLRCNGNSLLLNFYLSRIGRIESTSCNACGHPALHTLCLILHCPASDTTSLAL